VGSDRLAGSATRRCRLTAKLDLGAKTGSGGVRCHHLRGEHRALRAFRPSRVRP